MVDLELQAQAHDLALQDQAAAHEEAMYAISYEYDGEKIAAQLAGDEARLIARQAFESAELSAKIEAEKQKALLIEDGLKREQSLLEAAHKANLEQTKLANKQELDLLKLRNKNQLTIDRERVSNQRSTFAAIASLSNSNNRELAIIGKGAALTQIAIDTPVAVGRALAAFPPPFNFVAAAAVGAAMAAQAAQVAGLNFATGGIVPGNSFSGDKVTANVNSREMVLNVAQQKRLFDIANGEPASSERSMSVTNSLLAQLIDAVKENQSIQIDGREIVSVVRNNLSAGRTI
ncbi:hypothetical protein D3C87_1341110 [compost metagenome]